MDKNGDLFDKPEHHDGIYLQRGMINRLRITDSERAKACRLYPGTKTDQYMHLKTI